MDRARSVVLSFTKTVPGLNRERQCTEGILAQWQWKAWKMKAKEDLEGLPEEASSLNRRMSGKCARYAFIRS